MHRYDYSFLKSEIPGSTIRLTGVIADLNAKEGFRKLQYSETFASLRQKAIIASVKGSNAIEGIVTTDNRINEIVNGADPVTHDELEIAGYKDALNLIHRNYGNMDINESTILMFHRLIEEGADPSEAGRYKTVSNYILEYSPDGKRRVRFKPVPPKEVPDNMEQLLLAYYDARQDPDIPALLLIPCFILDLLCIHPFRDGNGRVSRLLTVLLLYLSDYDIVRYISYEGQVDKYKASYYEALERSSALWHENRNDYIPVIINFLQILYRCFKELDDAFTDISLKKASKSERVENIVLNAVVPISKQEILKKLPDVSVKTAEIVLSRLLKENKIQKIGSYKDARYMKK